jgi:hypothetical protein
MFEKQNFGMGYCEYVCCLCDMREDEYYFWIIGVDEKKAICRECEERVMSLKKPCKEHGEPENTNYNARSDLFEELFKCEICKCWYCGACKNKGGESCKECGNEFTE